MLTFWLDGVLRLLRERRAWVLSITALLTVGSGALLTRLAADPSPRALLDSADSEQARVASDFRARFGSTDNIVALLIETKQDVLTPVPLGYMHALGEAMAALPHVERVESLARMPFRRPPSEVDDSELTLDALDDPAPDPVGDDPKLLGAMSDVVAAAPEIFPLGLASLSEKMGAQKPERIITSDAPSADDAKALASAVEDTPLLKGRLISKDRRFALVAVVFDDALLSHKDLSAAVDGVTGWLEAHRPPDGVKVHVAGLPVVRTTIVTHMRRDQAVLTPGTLVVSLVLLMLAFRWWAGVALPLIKVAVTSLWVLGGMALFGVKLNVVTNILPALLIIIGLSDSIHLVSRYLEEHKATRDAEQSLLGTVRAIGGACFATSGTTAAGLFSLYVSKTRMLAEFGVVGGVGVLLSYLATIIVLPAMLRGLVPPAREARHADAAQRPARGPLDRLVVRTTLFVLRHPKSILLVALSLTIAAVAIGRNVRVDSALLDQFAEDDPIYVTTKVLEDQFDGIRPLEVSLSSTKPGRFLEPDVLAALSAVGDWARAQDGVLSTMDPSDTFEAAWRAMTGDERALRDKAQLAGIAYLFSKQTPSPLDAFMTPDGAHARLRLRLADGGSRATLSLVERLEHELAQKLGRFDDISYALTGDAYVSSHGLDAVVSDLTGSLGTAVVVILLIIVAVFRSVRYGLLAIPPNVIPLVFALAWMAIRDIPLNAATAIIFSVSIGMAVDGSIHMLSRMREELHGSPLLSTAIMRAARGTGRALVIASASLLLGFSVLLLSSFIPVQRFAELIAVSIASCLGATLIVLPALLRVAGRRFVR
jgi:predicted RND superfamily exporter protein